MSTNSVGFLAAVCHRIIVDITDSM